MEFIRESKYGEFLLSTNKAKLDVEYVHAFLSKQAYWSPNVPRETVERSIENALCVGMYWGQQQIGFARVITDYATFAYLADVFVDPDFRSRGLAKRLMEFICSLDFVGSLRRFLLATRDAHGLYDRYGFTPLKKPERFMEIHRPSIYSGAA